MFWLWDSARPVFSIEKSAVPDETQLRSLRQLLRKKKPGSFLQDADAARGEPAYGRTVHTLPAANQTVKKPSDLPKAAPP